MLTVGEGAALLLLPPKKTSAATRTHSAAAVLLQVSLHSQNMLCGIADICGLLASARIVVLPGCSSHAIIIQSRFINGPSLQRSG